MAEMINETGVVEETTITETNETTKTYTQEEVLALLQSETDKRVSQALKTQQKKYEKQLSLSKLDGEERVKAEQANRIAELEEMVAQMNIANNKSELKSVLSSRGLSAEFADIITITDDIEQSQANIDALDRLFKAAVKAEVEKRLAGNAPKGNSGTPAEITKESAAKMSMTELNQLAQTNPDLFNKHYATNAILTFAKSVWIENSEIPDTLEVHGKYIKNFFRAKIRLFGEKIIGILGFLVSVRPYNTSD